MSLVDYAKKKALDFVEATYKQAAPGATTSVGSAIRSLFILPMAMVNAGLVQEIDRIKRLRLSNASSIGITEMKDLALNLMIEMPEGSRSVANVRVYVSTPQEVNVDTIPYFSTQAGIEFMPTSKFFFTYSDYIDDNGELYLTIPVIAVNPGAIGNVDDGEISNITGFPISTTRVSNSAARGGQDEMSSEEFFAYIQSVLSDGTLTQPGGARRYITTNYPDAESMILSAGDKMIIRDEVWTSDGVNPNLDRIGAPWAAHEDIGTVSPNANYGRIFVTNGGMDSSYVGKRIAISGDVEVFRKILSVIDENTIVVSGPPVESDSTASVWADGPRVLVASDIYLYFPNIEVQSTVIDRRQYLIANGAQAGTLNKVYVDYASGFTYADLYSSGRVVINEGTSSELIIDITSIGEDGNGKFLSFNAASISVQNQAPISYYNMSEIVVGEDIQNTPVLYVLQIDRLDPLSFDVVESIPMSEPGNFASPGWYIKETDPSTVFSSREEKVIAIDEKSLLNGYKELDLPICNVTSSEEYYDGIVATPGVNKISVVADLYATEGREVVVNISNYELLQPTITGASVSGGGSQTLTVTGMNVSYLSDVGYRDDVYVIVRDGSNNVLSTHNPGTVKVYGNKIRKNSGSFSSSANNIVIYFGYEVATLPVSPPPNTLVWIGGQLNYWSGFAWTYYTNNVSARQPYIRGSSYEDVIISTDGSTYVELTEKAVGVRNSSGWLTTNNISIHADKSADGWNNSPIRVVYATRSALNELQTVFESSDIRVLCGDTLIRSFYPTVIDTEIAYRGSSTPQALFDRFIELLQTSIRDRRADGEEVRVDMSNIIAALDDEGLADAIDVNFEVKVTNYLDDGEYVVRYLNPSEATRQELAVVSNIADSSGDQTIDLRRLKTTADIPGRGRLFLGGNNPNTQESIPYEGVIDNEDGTYTFIIRSGYSLQYAHTQWETAIVAVRDYDPELEYDGAILIPKNNRPYIRNMTIIKESLT